jgi:hypothetical protein
MAIRRLMTALRRESAFLWLALAWLAITIVAFAVVTGIAAVVWRKIEEAGAGLLM